MVTTAPVRVGVLHDFDQPDGGEYFAAALRLGLDESSDRRDRPVELVTELAHGLPAGTAHDVERAWSSLVAAGVLVVVGPSVSDNALVARDLAAETRTPAINYSGGERTRGPWMLHYQVGSLEEEPAVLARRLADRGVAHAAVVYDDSPVGRGYLGHLDAARADVGVEIVGTAAVSPLADDVRAHLQPLRAVAPDALVYLGLGHSARAVAVALAETGWSVPVVANSALMFGYREPTWRDGWRGWEYVDTVADDNAERRRLAERSRAAAGSPIGCAAYDIGRLVGAALARIEHLTREGMADALRRVKRLPAASGHDGTLMGFGVYDHAALSGEYLVLREWRDGRTVQVGPATL